MSKRLALIALLLPFSGYAITKHERRHEILQELHRLEQSCDWYKDLIKHNAWILYISGSSLCKELTDIHDKAVVLEAELHQIELELMQEQVSCTKK